MSDLNAEDKVTLQKHFADAEKAGKPIITMPSGIKIVKDDWVR